MELIFSLRGCQDFVHFNLTGLTPKTYASFVEATRKTRIFNTTMGFFVLMLGIPGSIFCSIIFYRNASKRNPLAALLIANSVSSMVFLILSVPKLMARCYYYPIWIPKAVCGTYRWIVATANCVNIWSLMMLLTSRFLAIALPHTFFNRVTGRRGFNWSLAVLVALSSVYCLRFFYSDWSHSCGLDTDDVPALWAYVSVEFVLPVAYMMCLSVFMLLLVKSGKSKSLSTSLYNQSVLFIQLSILNSAWIFISILPSIIHTALPFSNADDSETYLVEWDRLRFLVAETVAMDTFFLRHALDIALYVACSRRFRAQLAELWHLNKLCTRRLRSMVIMRTGLSTGVGGGGTFQTDESSRSNRLALEITRSAMFIVRNKRPSETDDSPNDYSS